MMTRRTFLNLFAIGFVAGLMNDSGDDEEGNL